MKYLLSIFLLTGCMAPISEHDDHLVEVTVAGYADYEDVPRIDPAEEVSEPTGSNDPQIVASEEVIIPANTGGTVSVAGPAPSTGGTPVQVTPVTGGAPSSGGETADPVEPVLTLSAGCQGYWDYIAEHNSNYADQWVFPWEETTVYHCCYSDPGCDLGRDLDFGSYWSIWWGCAHTTITNMWDHGFMVYDEDDYAGMQDRYTKSFGCH